MIDELILASSSPRRQNFLREMGYQFKVQNNPIEENFSSQLKGAEIALFLAQKKTIPFQQKIQKKSIDHYSRHNCLVSATMLWQT